MESRKVLSCKKCGVDLEARNWHRVLIISLLTISMFVVPAIYRSFESWLVQTIFAFLLITIIIVISLKVFITYSVVENDS